MSRGGLYAYSRTALNPDKVACVYAEAPVLDIRSWPGGRGTGPGSPADWETCHRAWGLRTERQLARFRHQPLDQVRRPWSWQNLTFERIRMAGGFLLSGTLEAGKLTRLNVTSTLGGTLVLHPSMGSRVWVDGQPKGGERLELVLPQGRTATLTTRQPRKP